MEATVKIFLKYDEQQFPPLLTLYIHGAPHRRQDKAVLKAYRDAIWQAAKDQGIFKPIDVPIDLRVTFIDPTSPDLDNILTALYRVLDGKALKGPSLLTDDGLIQAVNMMKFYPNGPLRSENRVP
jgi:Holliday junction resolvase RusA-like endonuclease